MIQYLKKPSRKIG